VPSPGQDPGRLSGLGGVFNIINMHAYHYAGNNPVKYVDPDGEAIWIPFLIIGAITVGLLQSSNQPNQPMTVGRSLAIDMQLRNIRYNEGGQRTPEIRATGSRDRHGNILLESNPALRLTCSLPTGGLSPNDFSDGKTTSVGTTIGAISLGGSTLSNYMSKSESDAYHTDVRLHYTRGADGSILEWNIKATFIDPSNTKPSDIILNESEAMMYLHNNRERLIRDGTYNQIENLLN